MNLAFIMCVESGALEGQVNLLCKSIRNFCGQFKSSPIYVFQPREGDEIAPETLAFLKATGAIYINERLNTNFTYYPISNKIFACAWAEKNLQEEILVFLDSDTFFCAEPTEFLLPKQINCGVRPVDKQGIGSSGLEDINDEYWRKLYEICGIKTSPFVRTTLSQVQIRAYFNAGLVVVRRSAGLFQEWMNTFLHLMQLDYLPLNRRRKYRAINHMDQIALAAILSKEIDTVKILSEKYNYPLPLRAISQSPMATAQLDQLVHVHYHRWFNKPNFLQLVRPELSRESPVIQWLEPHLPLQPVIDDLLKHRGVETLEGEECQKA